MKIRSPLLVRLLPLLVAGLVSAHQYDAGPLTVFHPWARATAPGASVAAVYLRVDNHGAAGNITPAVATCRMKFRYSKAIDPAWVIESVEAAARRNGLDLVVRQEGTPPELPVDHPFVQRAAAVTAASPDVGAFGSDASQFATVAPTLILGPGSMEQAHKPEEFIALEQLERSIAIFQRLAIEQPMVAG